MSFGKRFVVILALLVFAAPAFAGFGIHLNYGMNTIDEENTSFKFAGDPANYTTSTLEREESSNPTGVGFDLTLNIIPIVDFQISLELSAASYDVVFTPAPLSGMEEVVFEDTPYVQAGIDGTVMVKPGFLSFPPVVGVIKGFIGGGPSLHLLFPILSEKLALDNLDSATDEFNEDKLIEETNISFGFHAIAGFKIKPPAFPVGLRVYGKYYMMSGVDEPGLSSWMTIGAGIYLGG
jgi:hypothetical protein